MMDKSKFFLIALLFLFSYSVLLVNAYSWGQCVQNPPCRFGDPPQTQTCGNCNTGTKTITCQSNNQWGDWGQCIGEGCSPGQPQTETQDCGEGCGTQSRTRTCTSSCNWDSWSSWGTCTLKSGNACYSGDTQTQGCSTDTACGGTESRTCSSCQWGSWGGICSGGTDCNSFDSWYGGGNTQQANCGSRDDDTVSEYRDYRCSGGSCTYTPTQTTDCNAQDGWYGGGNRQGCGTDDNSEWKDWYAIENTNTCTSTITCTFNCDGSDICNNRCEGNVFVSTPPMQDFYVVTNTNTCTSTPDSPVREDCLAKPTTDTDGSSTAYTTAGTVTDFTGCTTSGCSSTAYNDACSGTILTEYGADGVTSVSNQKNCEDYEELKCLNDRYYRDELGCSGNPGACVDTADTFAETDPDGDGVDQSCGDGSCYLTREVCDTAVSGKCVGKTPTETNCADGKDNDCDSLTDCADSDCDPDIYQNCCLSAVDQTPRAWEAGNHRDAGIEYSTNADVYNTLFNSNGGSCTASGGTCFNANNAPVNHKSALVSGNCCGNEANEFYKPNWYGGECTDNADDCVWSTGDAQSSNTGNTKSWCYLHEWYECKNSEIGKKAGSSNICCAGVVGNNAWTPTPLRENQYSCTDNIDNDCDSLTDCADSDCAGQTGPNNVICCQAASVDADCGNDDCKIENCVNNVCSIQNRPAGETDECNACNACDTAGGNCVGLTADGGKNCNDDCTYCNAGTCSNRPAGAVDECNNCHACDTAGGNCVGLNAETGKNCIADCYDCVSGTCTAMTESNDGGCVDDCNYCNAGSCTNRNQCETAECSAGYYCNALGGDCKHADESSDVCLNCAPDQTSGLAWTWTPSNHEDAGKGYNANLFNSNAATCSAESGGNCFDSNNNAVNHKSALGSGNCCGDDANEFYKPDYHGPECTNHVNDCVWSTGDAQSSNTGNAEYWCYVHEWYPCDNAQIGTKTGGAEGVTCAGIVGNNAWTPNSNPNLVKPENQYSTTQINACTDGLDNDGDTFKDCDDSDCAGSISGFVRKTNNDPIQSANVNSYKDLTQEQSAEPNPAVTNYLGKYDITKINCGTYNLVASHEDYAPKTKTNIQVAPNQQVTVNFEGSSGLVLGTSCEADCTFLSDTLVHVSCEGKGEGTNRCTFYDSTAKASCDFSQPGWERDYSSPQCENCYVVCPSGTPQEKVEIPAEVTCEKGTLVKAYRITTYNGKPVKLVVAMCG